VENMHFKAQGKSAVELFSIQQNQRAKLDVLLSKVSEQEQLRIKEGIHQVRGNQMKRIKNRNKLLELRRKIGKEPLFCTSEDIGSNEWVVEWVSYCYNEKIKQKNNGSSYIEILQLEKCQREELSVLIDNMDQCKQEEIKRNIELERKRQNQKRHIEGLKQSKEKVERMKYFCVNKRQKLQDDKQAVVNSAKDVVQLEHDYALHSLREVDIMHVPTVNCHTSYKEKLKDNLQLLSSSLDSSDMSSSLGVASHTYLGEQEVSDVVKEGSYNLWMDKLYSSEVFSLEEQLLFSDSFLGAIADGDFGGDSNYK
uniref:hypothetical protein n=1 Tax=Candidatus Ichthyocystis sparus TaxID=1561004 RepID=UPI00159ECBDA